MHRYGGVDTSSDSMSVTNGLLVMGLFHYTNERWLSATPETKGLALHSDAEGLTYLDPSY